MLRLQLFAYILWSFLADVLLKQETQRKLDTVPRHIKMLKICLSVLPKFQFSIHLITQTLFLLDIMSRYSGLTVH